MPIQGREGLWQTKSMAFRPCPWHDASTHEAQFWDTSTDEVDTLALCGLSELACKQVEIGRQRQQEKAGKDRMKYKEPRKAGTH